jgi:hypothetical protein|tara:strand:+ start:1966 stop:2313 length:348 start_codon:yes stop_codon:yes gene_type:complete
MIELPNTDLLSNRKQTDKMKGYWRNPTTQRKVKYVGTNPDLTYGEHYTYAELAEHCGIVTHTMRGRLRNKRECSDAEMWKMGERKPKSEWTIVADTLRCESDADRMSQKWLRVAL